MSRNLIAVTAMMVVLAGCNCNPAKQCSSDNDCFPNKCISGTCTGNAGGGAGGNGGGSGGAGGGGTTIVTGCNPNASDNGSRDTDCDGISDAEEYSKTYPGNNKTDPCNSDSDGDGVPDGVEAGKVSSVASICASKFVPDSDPNTVSDPTRNDTDGDGLLDGQEDKNHDGKVDPGESSPSKKDSDCDGLSDKEEVDGTNGCVTDPLKKDSDGDGLPDGVEVGLQSPGADALCMYGAEVFDTDGATKTNACNPDTDGDQIPDGAEDSNANGKVDPGKLDPTNPTDAVGPAQDVCTVANLKPINFHKNQVADSQIALVPTFTEVQVLNDGSGDRGIIFYDSTNNIAGFILSKTPVGADGVAEETDGRAKLGSTGTLSGSITQTFTTWDGFTNAVRATYDQNGTGDLKAQVNAMAKAYLGNAMTGALTGTSVNAGGTPPFKVQAEFIHRTATRSVVAVAVIPGNLYTAGQNLFNMDDVAGGSAVAQAPDYSAPQCEVFLSTNNSIVDFLWVVDDSGSMGGYQTAVGNAGTAFGTKLASAGIDWRVGAVTTGYYGSTTNTSRPFTNSLATMQTWFATGGASPPQFGTSGNSIENSLQSAQQYIAALLPKVNPPTTANAIRVGAALHLIVFGDADDQSGTLGPAYDAFFANYDGAGSKAVVHGLVCPQGQANGCGETQATPRKNLSVIANSGGVTGDINVAQSGSAQLTATIDAILAAAIAGTGHQLLRPPLSATIKVAIEANGTTGACPTSNVPRSRTNGFDFDSASRRIVFYGTCIPNGAGKKVAVSYKYWLDGSPDPNGCACPAPKVCGAGGACVCPTNCGGVCQAGTSCDIASCTCGPGIN